MKSYMMAFALLLSGIPVAEAEDDEFIAIHEFKNKSGVSLGQLQVRYISRDIVDSLKIVKTTGKQEEVLYQIDKSLFYNRDALEQEVYDPGFYGYRIAGLATDQVTLTYMRNRGRTASDNIVIQWDGESFHRHWIH